MPRGIKALVTCTNCDGAGVTGCGACGGNGCDACDGSGRYICTVCSASGQIRPQRKARTKVASSVEASTTNSEVVTHCLAFIDAHDKLTDKLQSELLFWGGGLRHLDVMHQSEEYKTYLLYRDIADCAKRKLGL